MEELETSPDRKEIMAGEPHPGANQNKFHQVLLRRQQLLEAGHTPAPLYGLQECIEEEGLATPTLSIHHNPISRP